MTRRMALRQHLQSVKYDDIVDVFTAVHMVNDLRSNDLQGDDLRSFVLGIGLGSQNGGSLSFEETVDRVHTLSSSSSWFQVKKPEVSLYSKSKAKFKKPRQFNSGKRKNSMKKFRDAGDQPYQQEPSACIPRDCELSESTSSSSFELVRLATLHGCLDIDTVEKESIFLDECSRQASLAQTISTDADDFMQQLMKLYESNVIEVAEDEDKDEDSTIIGAPVKDIQEITGLHCFADLQEYIIMERRRMELKAELESLPKGRMYVVLKLKLQLCLAMKIQRPLRPAERLAELKSLRQSAHIKSLVLAF